MGRKARNKPWKGPLPSSGEVLGGLAGLFDWKPRRRVISERTWRTYTSGGNIHDKTRQTLFEEVVMAALKGAELRGADGQPLERAMLVEGLAQIIKAHADWWDSLPQRMVGELPARTSTLTNVVVLRLAFVELAIRLAALSVAQPSVVQAPGEKPERVEVPESLLTTLLRALLKHGQLSRTALAQMLNVSKEAVDQWLKPGKVIPLERLDAIAGIVAEKAGGEPEKFKVFLRATRLWTRTFAALRERVGQDELNALVDGIWRLTQRARRECERYATLIPETHRADMLAGVVVLGSTSWPGPAIRAALAQQESDDEWRNVIAAVPHQEWGPLLARTLSLEETGLRLAKWVKEENFQYLVADKESLHQHQRRQLLVPPARLPEPLAQLQNLNDDAVLGALLGMVCQRSQFLLGRKGEDPEDWQEMMSCAEFCRLIQRFAKTPLQQEACLQISWMSYATGLLLLMASVVALEDVSRVQPVWKERIRGALAALPPFPEEGSPDLDLWVKSVRSTKQELERLLLLLEG